jgi:hypothetical protein
MSLIGIIASASAPPPTSPVAGYKAWYDASDTATITVSGNAVTQWNDKSANAYNLTQGTAAYRPSSGTRTINSKNVIDFDGSNDLLKAATASNWTFLSNSGGSSIFLVILCDTSSTFQSIWSTLFDLSSSSVGTSFTRRTDDKTDLFVRNANSGNGAIGSNDQGTLTDATAIYYTALLDPNNGTTLDRAISRVSGGAEIKNNTFTQSPSASVASEPLHIGDYTPGGGLGFDGVIGEVLFYDSVLSATDRAKNESYLKNKWGL